MPTLHLIKNDHGIILRYGKCEIAFDTGKEELCTLLSHSHMDHVGEISRSKKIISTKATAYTEGVFHYSLKMSLFIIVDA